MCGLNAVRLMRQGHAQGAVMMVQNRYQRRRMYTRIALGKNRAMDVVSGETSGGSGQLLFLYPLLFALQILQCWIGGSGAHIGLCGSLILLRSYCAFYAYQGCAAWQLQRGPHMLKHIMPR